MLRRQDEVRGVDVGTVDAGEADRSAADDGDHRVAAGGSGHVGRKGGRSDAQAAEVNQVLTSSWVGVEAGDGVGAEGGEVPEDVVVGGFDANSAGGQNKIDLRPCR